MLQHWSGWECKSPNSFNLFPLSLKLIKKIEFPSDVFMLSLFAIYSIILAPKLTKFLIYGEKNYFVAFFGFLIYILEIFAFRFKLYMIRLRAEEARIKIKNTTGKDVLMPRVGGVAWIGVFCRVLFRAGMLIISIYALGISIQGGTNAISVLAGIAVILFSLFDIVLTIYLMVMSNLYNPEISKKWEFDKELEASEKWVRKELRQTNQDNFFIKELLSDIILQVYSFMLYTGLWDYINDISINMAEKSHRAGASALDTGINLFGMLFFMILFALPTLRLAYWIEGYAMAYSDKERWRIRGAFCLAAVITIAPALRCYYELFLSKALLSY